MADPIPVLIPPVTIKDTKHSFIKFSNIPDMGYCFDAAYCIPVFNEDDTYFQFTTISDTVQESEDIFNQLSTEVRLRVHKGSDNIPPAPNDGYEVTGAFLKYRTGLKEITFVWSNPIADLFTFIECDECFQFAVEFLNEDMSERLKFSNCLIRRCGESCYYTLLEYNNDEDFAGFMYCNVPGFVNRVRLPFYLSKPQFSDEESIYVRSDGSFKVHKSVTKKEYEAKTELMPETFHEKLKIALSHDSVSVTSEKYTGAIRKSGAYEIDWVEFLDYPIAQATFKAFATPYNVRNNNCADCEPVVVCSTATNIQSFNIFNTPDPTWRINIGIIDLAPPPNIEQTIDISYRQTGAGLFVSVGQVIVDTTGTIIDPPPPFVINPIPNAWTSVEVKVVNPCNNIAYIQQINQPV